MLPIFANSSIGTDAVTPATDVVRAGLNCATAAQLAACKFVKTDGISFLVHGGLKFGLAHVRVESQIADLAKLKNHVPQNTPVTIHKIHLYDATHTVPAIGAHNTAGLTTQVLV